MKNHKLPKTLDEVTRHRFSVLCPWPNCVSAVTMFLLLAWQNLSALQPEPDAVFVRVIDVGPGLCCVIKIPGDKYLIYDAGNKSYATSKILELIPTNSPIELMVLSHSDSDHLGSVKKICDNYVVKKVIHSGLPKPTTTWSGAMTAIKNEVATDHCQEVNLAKTPLVPGTTLTFGEVTVTEVFGLSQPPAAWGFTKTKHSSEFYNSGSIVVRLEFHGKSVLFAGDTVGRFIGDPTS
jgi:beta-lactamase superfamily II metal-dependent hydrolase